MKKTFAFALIALTTLTLGTQAFAEVYDGPQPDSDAAPMYSGPAYDCQNGGEMGPSACGPGMTYSDDASDYSSTWTDVNEANQHCFQPDVVVSQGVYDLNLNFHVEYRCVSFDQLYGNGA